MQIRLRHFLNHLLLQTPSTKSLTGMITPYGQFVAEAPYDKRTKNSELPSVFISHLKKSCSFILQRLE